MKATFDKQKLLAALTPAAGISQTRNTLVSVDGLLFECPIDPRFGETDGTESGDLCRISAFDLEKGLRTTVECEIDEPGLFVINTVKILQIIRAMPDGLVTISIDDKCRVRITGGQSSFDITATLGEEFPTMPMFVGERVYTLPQYMLKKLLGQSIYAVAQNEQRASFNGALFRIQDGELTIVGCDGNRLAAAKCMLPSESGAADARMLIPGKFLGELSKLLRDTEDELTMMIGRKHIIFKLDSIYFFTRMLDTEYVAYEKFLPVKYRTEVYVSTDDLRSAIERASVVTEDKLGGSGKPPIKLDIAEDAITLSSVSSGGSVHERVPAAIGGASLSLGFNCRYLLDALRAVPTDCETLRIRLIDASMGIMIEPSCGTGFSRSTPDESVFGERGFDVPAEVSNEGSGEDENVRSEFMSFIMPLRMNS